jgi:biotin transport system substrate-specific component
MKLKTGEITQIALFAALTAVGAFVRIPLPFVPFTLQTFFVALSGVLLGAKKGMLSQLVYVFAGLAGAPIFTKGGGIGYVLEPTFGYLAGFVASACIIGRFAERMKGTGILKIYGMILAGVLVTYLVGVPYLYIISNLYLGVEMSVGKAVYYGFVMFIGGDAVSLYLAAAISSKLLPALRRAGLARESIREKSLQ